MERAKVVKDLISLLICLVVLFCSWRVSYDIAYQRGYYDHQEAVAMVSDSGWEIEAIETPNGCIIYSAVEADGTGHILYTYTDEGEYELLTPKEETP